MIINIFCDASINTSLRIACPGVVTTLRYEDGHSDIYEKETMIMKGATNNSAEIMAILMGVRSALRLSRIYPGTVIRLFSDSKISIFGLREWLPNWVQNMKGTVLMSSTGQPVANQQTFIKIFNLIVRYDLKIEFYHQSGHVKNTPEALKRASADFITSNKIIVNRLGTSIEEICYYNNFVDELTREVEKLYIRQGQPAHVFAYTEGCEPVQEYLSPNLLFKYKRNIARRV